MIYRTPFISYDTDPLIEDFKLLTGYSENKLEYLSRAYDILIKYKFELSQVVGKLEYFYTEIKKTQGSKRDIMKNFNLSENDLIDIIELYVISESLCEVVQESMNITKKKVDKMSEASI